MNFADQPVIVNADHVSMRFNLAQEKTETLKEYLVKMLRGKLLFNEFYALKDVQIIAYINSLIFRIGLYCAVDKAGVIACIYCNIVFAGDCQAAAAAERQRTVYINTVKIFY